MERKAKEFVCRTFFFHLFPERDRGRRRRSLRSLRPGAAAPAPARCAPPRAPSLRGRRTPRPKGRTQTGQTRRPPTRRARAGRGPRRGEARAGVSGPAAALGPRWGESRARPPPRGPRRPSAPDGARSSPLAVRSSRGSPASGVASAAIGGRGGAGGPRGHPGQSSWTRPRPDGPAPGPVRPREGGAPGPRSPSAP